jgi:ribonuclease T2
MSRARLAAVLCAAVIVSATLVAPAPLAAQDVRQNTPGEFDFYVLSLSWSPSFCEAGAERGSASPAAQQQCGERPYAFVVHGFWPQYDRGFPEYCQQPAPRLDRNIVASMLDLMPGSRLIYHEWDRHGTCSGLSARAYFDAVRKARAIVKIPTEYLDIKEPLTVTPDAVEEAFVNANPGLTRKSIAVGCDNRRLREVRVCMGKDLRFRDCDEVDRRACRREQLVMPPVRPGGRTAAENGAAQNN